MTVSATELMKTLKYIEEEINEIHRNDVRESYAPVERETVDGKVVITTLYESTYDFMSNRARIEELHKEERRIKNTLAKFNIETKVIGFDFSVAEALVRIAELKGEIRVLSDIVRTGPYTLEPYSNAKTFKKALYDLEVARNVLKKYQRELSAIQVAVDKTNLNSTIDY